MRSATSEAALEVMWVTVLCAMAITVCVAIALADRKQQPIRIVCEQNTFEDIAPSKEDPYLRSMSTTCNVGDVNGPVAHVFIID
jgi:hypothetical protein